jgi:hypothetical protein
MSGGQINVILDDRIRLLSGLLALTTWPLEEQSTRPHGVHAHVKATRSYLKEFEDHGAVALMQELLESGLTLDTIFSYIACLDWPGLRARAASRPEWGPKEWPAQMRDFMHASRIKTLWENDAETWMGAVESAKQALEKGEPLNFLTRFFGSPHADLAFQPNLSFPTSRTLGFRWDKRLVCVCPPHIAWGNNPPWLYNEDSAGTMREAFTSFAQVLLRELLLANPDVVETAKAGGDLPVPNTFRANYPDWVDQFVVLVVSGATALFLDETYGAAESKAYMMMAHKAHGFEALSSVTDVLKRYLDGQAEGKYGTFLDYMPVFRNGLRVAERLRNM